MRHFIVAYIPWLVSGLTIFYVSLAGCKHRHTWIASFIAQCFWMIWIVASHTWGLIPVTVWLMVLSVLNHYKWKRDNEIVSI